MSHKLAAKFVATLHSLRERGQSGQNSLEYVGIAVVAALVIVAITTAVTGADVGGKLSEAISKIFGG